MNKILSIIGLIIGLSFGSIVMAQNYTNFTNNIQLVIEENNSDWKLNYTITHTFNRYSQARHGIFYDISKNQDGVLYDFAIDGEPTLDGVKVKYEVISEINSFRIRFGDKDVLVPEGEHVYQFNLKTKTNKDYNHQFTAFYNWQDKLNSANIIYQNQDICLLKNDCVYNPVINLNPSKPKPNIVLTNLQVFQSYLWVIFGTIIAWFTVLRSKFKDTFRTNFTSGIPFYSSPNDMMPWSIESIMSKGQLNTKDTLAAYILYLHHKKIIKLVPKSQDNNKIELRILQTLPDGWLPDGYNKIVLQMAEDGLENGLVNSRIQESSLKSKTQNYILKQNNDYYLTNPELQPFSITFLTTVVCGVIGLIIYFVLRNYLLIGTSAIIFVLFCFLITMIILFLYLINKDKFNQVGFDIFKEASGYKYYIGSIEKEKLNFDNNPEQGAKFYLANVPYAAQFGQLKKFNQYFQSLDFIQPETISTGIIVSNTLSYSTFYIEPSDSGYGGSSGGGGGGFSGGGGSW